MTGTVDDGPAAGAVVWVMAWPGITLDRLAMQVMRQAIADAVAQARAGEIESEPLTWLWDVGRNWAEISGDCDFKTDIANICEEIEIMAYACARGECYQIPRPMWLGLCKWWRRR